MGYTPSKKEIAQVLSEKETRKSLPNNMRLISFKNITIDRHPAVMYEGEMTLERVDVSLKIRILQFTFIKGRLSYHLQCQVSGLSDEDLSLKMQKYLPLFKMVANSIVENSQY